jgi:hypothetical protein
VTRQFLIAEWKRYSCYSVVVDSMLVFSKERDTAAAIVEGRDTNTSHSRREGIAATCIL